MFVHAGYIKAGVNPDDIEGIYKKAHEAIRADPTRVKKEKKAAPVDPKGKIHKPKRWNKKKLTLAQRKERVSTAKANFLKKLGKESA